MWSTFIPFAPHNGWVMLTLSSTQAINAYIRCSPTKQSHPFDDVAQNKAHQFHSIYILRSLTANANRLPFASSIVCTDHNTLVRPQPPLSIAPNQTNNADLVSVLSVYNNGCFYVMQNFR